MRHDGIWMTLKAMIRRAHYPILQARPKAEFIRNIIIRWKSVNRHIGNYQVAGRPACNVIF